MNQRPISAISVVRDRFNFSLVDDTYERMFAQVPESRSLKVKVFCHAGHVGGLHFETRADPEFMGAELYSRIRDAIPDLETFVQHTLIGGYSRSHLHVLYGTGSLLCYMAPDSSTCELLV